MDGKGDEMKLKDLYLSGKAQNKELSTLKIDRKIEKRIDRYSLLFHFITFLPFIIIFVNLIRFISASRPIFFVILALAILMICVILVFNSYINILLYKEYTKEAEENIVNFFNKFDKKSFLVTAFINIFVIVMVVLIAFIILVNLFYGGN